MNWIPVCFRHRELFDDLSEEMRLHVEERVEHLIARGSEPAAKRSGKRALHSATWRRCKNAAVRFGNGRPWSRYGPTFASRYAQLKKSPGFTLIAIVTLAMAVGANAVVFGVFNGLILASSQCPRPAKSLLD